MPPSSLPPLAKGLTLVPATAAKPWAVLELHAEPVNSFTHDFYRSLRALLLYLPTTTPPTRGLIFHSTLPKRALFTAGNDLAQFFTPRTDRERFRAYWRDFQAGLLELYRAHSLLTLAAVRGYSGAAGTGLALACDYRLGTSDALMGLNESAIGVGVPPAWIELLADTLDAPRARAERMCTGAQMVGGEEALRLGLLDELVPSPGSDTKALLRYAEERMAALLKQGTAQGRARSKQFARRRLAEAWAAEAEDLSVADMYFDDFDSETGRTLVGKVLKMDKDGRPLRANKPQQQPHAEGKI